MKVTICSGSSCHIKGSREVEVQLRRLIAESGLAGRVELRGTLCNGNCQKGVCVTIDDAFHSVTPSTVDDFFKQEILAKF